ncbi:MAG TPA: DUF6268 family outer membrane beta-barrel protein, partial [Pedobacter sp.]
SMANAQSVDTLRKEVRAQIVDKFPSRRNFNFEYEQLGSGSYKPEFRDGSTGDNRITDHYRFSAALNLPLYKKGPWTVSVTGRYKYESFEITDAQNNNASLFTKSDFQLFSGSLNTAYLSRLFGKVVIYSGSVIADASDEHLGRIKGFGTVTMILKSTKNTTVTVGIVGVIDPASPFPALPVFSYLHRFENSEWSMDLILPQRLMFKRRLLENGRISIGTEMESEQLYVNLNRPDLRNVYDYRQSELKSGILYEYCIAKNLIASFKGGISNTLISKVTAKGESTNDYLFKTRQNGTGYFNIGLSFNPFSK